MCELCQMQFRFDHDADAAGRIPCPVCGKFYVDPEQPQCYHCFCAASELESCELCAEQGSPRATPVN